MNCKPGDLAYTVAPWFEGGRGRFVRVVRVATEADCDRLSFYFDSGAWYCEGDIVTEVWSGREGCISDEALRPIRDPGDDAVDEMLRPLPSELEPA